MRAIKYIVMTALIMLALAGVMAMATDDAQAASADNTWIADGSSSASVAGSWENGTLEAGQNIYFTSAHVGACAWDVTTAIGGLNIKGYTATITQSSGNILTVIYWYQSSGTFLGASNGYVVITGQGGFTKVGGVVTSGQAYLIFQGDGATYVSDNGLNLNGFRASCNMTMNKGITLNLANHGVLTVDAGKTLTIASGQTITDYGANYAVINGRLAGPGTYLLSRASGNLPSYANAVFTCPIIFATDGTTVATAALVSDLVTSSTITIVDYAASGTYTLDANDYNVTANNLIISTRGIFLGGNGIHHINNNWDSSAGTWTSEGSTVIIPDTNKTIKLAAGQSFNILQIAASSITPKWATNLAGGTMYLNITGLNASRTYNYYVDGVLQDPFDTTSTSLAWSYSTTGAHYFELREVAKISPVPINSLNYTRHSVGEGVRYAAVFTCDQMVTWSVAGADFITIDNGLIVAVPAWDDAGEYVITITATNANGETVLTQYLYVEDTQGPEQPAWDMMPAVIGLLITAAAVALVIGALSMLGRRKR